MFGCFLWAFREEDGERVGWDSERERKKLGWDGVIGRSEREERREKRKKQAWKREKDRN